MCIKESRPSIFRDGMLDLTGGGFGRVNPVYGVDGFALLSR
jgi:hypothetical protein